MRPLLMSLRRTHPAGRLASLAPLAGFSSLASSAESASPPPSPPRPQMDIRFSLPDGSDLLDDQAKAAYRARATARSRMHRELLHARRAVIARFGPGDGDGHFLDRLRCALDHLPPVHFDLPPSRASRACGDPSAPGCQPPSVREWIAANRERDVHVDLSDPGSELEGIAPSGIEDSTLASAMAAARGDALVCVWSGPELLAVRSPGVPGVRHRVCWLPAKLVFDVFANDPAVAEAQDTSGWTWTIMPDPRTDELTPGPAAGGCLADVGQRWAVLAPASAQEALAQAAGDLYGPAAGAAVSFLASRRALMGLGPSCSHWAARAGSLLAWHSRARFCTRCGSPMVCVSHGRARRCAMQCHRGAGGRIYARVDPISINMTVSPDLRKILLVRNRRNALLPAPPPRMLVPPGASAPPGPGTEVSLRQRRVYSLVAGHVEPGERAEAAAARETFEETGVSLVLHSDLQSSLAVTQQLYSDHRHEGVHDRNLARGVPPTEGPDGSLEAELWPVQLLLSQPWPAGTLSGGNSEVMLASVGLARGDPRSPEPPAPRADPAEILDARWADRAAVRQALLAAAADFACMPPHLPLVKPALRAVPSGLTRPTAEQHAYTSMTFTAAGAVGAEDPADAFDLALPGPHAVSTRLCSAWLACFSDFDHYLQEQLAGQASEDQDDGLDVEVDLLSRHL